MTCLVKNYWKDRRIVHDVHCLLRCGQRFDESVYNHCSEVHSTNVTSSFRHNSCGEHITRGAAQLKPFSRWSKSGMWSSQGAALTAASLTIFVVSATATQTLIPAEATGCPYIVTSCTRVELLPSRRNDTCHQDIASGFSQDVAAADEQQVNEHKSV